MKSVWILLIPLIGVLACEQGPTITKEAGQRGRIMESAATNYSAVTPDWSVGCAGQVRFTVEICTGYSDEGAPPFLFLADECYGFYPTTTETVYDSTAAGNNLACMCNFYSTEILDIDDWNFEDAIYSVKIAWYNGQWYEDWTCDFQREYVSCGGQGGKITPGQ